MPVPRRWRTFRRWWHAAAELGYRIETVATGFPDCTARRHVGGGRWEGVRVEFEYDPAATDMATPLDQAFAQRRGVCQDFAHLMLSCLRSLGLPARYVSGYVLTGTPAGRPRLVGADASHAWVASCCPDYGWVAFDPTNAKLAGTELIDVKVQSTPCVPNVAVRSSIELRFEIDSEPLKFSKT